MRNLTLPPACPMSNDHLPLDGSPPAIRARRTFLRATGAVFALGMLPAARAQGALPPVAVYKNPSCGCCGEWVKHMQANGFRVVTHEVGDVMPLWRLMRQCPYLIKGLGRAGFTGGWL